MIFKKLKYFAVYILGIMLLLSGISNAANNNKNNKGKSNLAKVSSSQIVTARMDINNLNALQANNGYSDYNLNSNLEGTEYPKGSNRNAVFQSGFLWGGYVRGDASNQVRVGGSTYSSGLQAGPIKSDGTAEDPTDPRWQIYRVRPDVYPGGPAVDLSADVAAYAEGGQSISESDLRTRYEADWKNWPAHGNPNAPDLGAPFTDVNGDGKYDPSIDIPGVPGSDQTIYYVANDLDPVLTTSLYGTNPLGIELHVTFWAYAQQGALGNMYFKKWDMINKGSNIVDSMFVSFWTDVDLGSATDDLVGCDTTLSMSFTYNGQSSDNVYAPLPPPADGFTFFQGPIVPGNPTDSAISIGWPFNFKYTHGMKNRPMTSAYYFINTTDANYGDPTFKDPLGSTEFYNFFNGEYGLSGKPFQDNNGNETKFAYYGDPVKQTGWLDPAPADKRQGMASGPFTFAPGDTQQVVVAEMFAGAVPSINYLQAVTLVKVYDQTAQSAYNHFFQLPSAPKPPTVNAVASNNKVVLDWGESQSAVNATENSNILDNIDGGAYTFEGYNVYQFPYQGASLTEAKLLATYDLKDGITTIPYTDPVTRTVEPSISIQNGTDSGIKRSFTITNDVFNSNKPLNNGTTYYFGVSAYSYNSVGIQQSLESTVSKVSVVPQSSGPGVRYKYNVGDTIVATHTSGLSQGSVFALVLDPSKLTGHQYKVTFDSTGGTTTWSLIDVTNNNNVLLSKQSNQSGDNSYMTVDGMLIKVTGPPAGMSTDGGPDGTGWTIPQGTRRITWGTTSLLTGYGLEGFNGAIGWASPDALYNGDPQSVPASALCNTLLTFAQVTDTTLFDPAFPPTSDVNLSFGYRYLRHAASAPADPRFATHIINTTGGTYPFQDFAQTVPLSAWNVDDPAHPARLVVGYLENNADGGLVDGKYWPPDYTQLDQSNTREFLWIYQAPYSTTVNAAYAKDALDATDPLPVMWFCLFSRRGPAQFSPSGTGADQFLIYANHVNTVNDQYSFTATMPTTNNALAKTDVNAINVFPNPYYGVNSQETSKYSRFVTFNHLPAMATIRIFNLAGIQVKVIQHTSGQFEQWDLTNESRLPVASGLYIVYIDMPTIGATKILKAAIIQEQQFPDHF